MGAIQASQGNSEPSTEFRSLETTLRFQRSRFEDYLGRIEKCVHKIVNTNYPSPENSAKEQVIKPQGFITDMQCEVSGLEFLNDRLQVLAEKMEKFI